MNYRVYARNDKYNWDLWSITDDYDKISGMISDINKCDYDHYMVIQSTDQDKVIEIGKLDKPKIYCKKKI